MCRLPERVWLLCLLILVTLPFVCDAEEAITPAAALELNGANTAWLLTATALVLFMTLPGLALFYGGLVRRKNVLSLGREVVGRAGLIFQGGGFFGLGVGVGVWGWE